jgi:hypothetical protein
VRAVRDLLERHVQHPQLVSAFLPAPLGAEGFVVSTTAEN